jgi:hypothetical protein
VSVEGPNEIHPLLAERTPRHRRFAAGDRRQAHHDRAGGRGRRGQGGATQAARRRRGRLRRKAPQRRPAARVHGGRRRRRPGAGGVRCAQRARRHEGGVRPARHLHSRQEDHARHRQNPRRRKPWHAHLRRGDRGLRRRPRHHRAAGGRSGRPALRRVGGPRRPGDRDQPHAQPPVPAFPASRAISAPPRSAPSGTGCRSRSPASFPARSRSRSRARSCARRSGCGWYAGSGTAPRPNGCNGVSPPSACGRSTRSSTSPISSPSTAAGRCTCSTQPK